MSKNFYEKLSLIQSNLEAIKGRWNKFGEYNYRSAEDILAALKPFLKEHSLFINLQDEIVLVGERYYIRATATLSDGAATQSSSAFAREPLDKKGMDASQITGSASSYARKYALSGLLGLDDEEDADATNSEGKETPKTTSSDRFQKSSSPASGSYEIKFGKFAKKKLSEVEKSELQNYMEYILRKAEEDKKVPSGDVKEFIDRTREYLRN